MSCNPGQGGLLHFGRGRKCQLDTHLKCVVLRGSWREMGRQYGALLKGELERTLEWANRLGSVESDRFFSPSDSPSGMAFMDALFGGISETSGLTLPELIRANGVEVAYGNELGGLLLRGGRCGALALDRTRSRDGRVVFCRNYDWLPSFRDLDLVVAVMEPEGERPLVSINFAGCLYLTTGMNGGGLFIELNSGLFASEVMKLERHQNAWELWNVLRGSSSVGEALDQLGRIPAAAHYLIGLGDCGGTALYEWAVDEGASCPVRPDPGKGFLAFTNHFIRPGWKNTSWAEVGGKTSSLSRCEALEAQAEQLPARAGLEDLKHLLSLDVSEGGARWEGTLFQVIAVPGQRRLLIRPSTSRVWHSLPWMDLLC